MRVANSINGRLLGKRILAKGCRIFFCCARSSRTAFSDYNPPGGWSESDQGCQWIVAGWGVLAKVSDAISPNDNARMSATATLELLPARNVIPKKSGMARILPAFRSESVGS